MDFRFSDSEKEIHARAQGYAEDILASGVVQREKNKRIPAELIRELGERKLLGVHVSQDLGGFGSSPIAYALALREIAKVDASVAVTMAVTNMVSEVIVAFADPSYSQRVVPLLMSGDYFAGAFALSEPGAGSDPGAMQTRARREGDEFVITGQKLWITSGDDAGAFIVWAKTDDTLGVKGISCFLVEKGAKGLSAMSPEHKMGLRASQTVALSLDEVRVPVKAMLGKENAGFKIAMMALDGGRIGIGSQSVGIGQAAISALLNEKESVRLLGAGQESALASFATDLEAAWLLTLRAAAMKGASQRFSQEAAMAKVLSSEAANRTVRGCLSMGQAHHLKNDSTLSRLMRDCRVTQIYEGTSEVQRIVIGRSIIAAVNQ